MASKNKLAIRFLRILQSRSSDFLDGFIGIGGERLQLNNDRLTIIYIL